MIPTILPAEIPQNAILGINYSGMHDSAIAIVSPDGRPVFAVSLERVSRVKQDGRFPSAILDHVPWGRIAKVAVSVEEGYEPAADLASEYMSIELDAESQGDRSHSEAFAQLLENIPVEKAFFPHHLSHAASAFWPSEFDDALCLVYDGGMANEDWFGGVYWASRTDGIQILDRFAAHKYANITFLYSVVTAVLGFSPLKHEGKITGLAAYGKENPACIEMLQSWVQSPEKVDGLSYWQDMYSTENAPVLKVNIERAKQLRDELADFSREDIAYCVQKMAEDHVIEILQALKDKGVEADNICLSGGLFANVKINQRVSELGFQSVFISPPMSDDGTALGAALQLASQGEDFNPEPQAHVFLGPCSGQEEITGLLARKNVQYRQLDRLSGAEEVAGLLAAGSIVAVYQGASEFGPRALGNRSILADAGDADINARLNQRLMRTEFMPFAPMCLIDDAEELFFDIENNKHAAQFMTITMNCKPVLKEKCPAVVHCDGTARPQLVTQEHHPFIYDVIRCYKQKTDKPAIVNTSFNVHEEPIICFAEDALKGFFESGLDYLYLDGALISLQDNKAVEVEYLKDKVLRQAQVIKQVKRDADSAGQLVHKVGSDLLHKDEVLSQEREERRVLWEHSQATERQLGLLDNELKALNSRYDAAKQEHEALSQSLAQEQANALHWQRLQEETDKRLQGVLNSRSWKVTAPIRWLASLFKG